MRRPVMAAVLLLSLIGVLVTPLTQPSGASAEVNTKPNVVLFLIDDATFEDVKYMPNVQSLIADRGTTFVRNYSPQPLCCPARATLLSGQYPHNHGVVDNKAPLGGFPAFNDNHTLATYLTPQYTTSIIGKYLNGMTDSSYIAPGWDDWRVPNSGTTYDYLLQTQNINGQMTDLTGYMPTVHGKQQREFLATIEPGTPFFSYLGWVAPHSGTPRGDVHLAPYVNERWSGSYDGPRLPNDESFNETHVGDKRRYVSELPLLTDSQIRQIKQKLVLRRESLQAVDKQVEQTIAKVAEMGHLNNTYFIFASDNGLMQGQHRINKGKQQLYEPSTRVPLIIRGPGFPAGTRYTDVTGLQDILPTVLDITDTPLPVGAPQPDGVSLLGLVNGTITTDRPIVLELAKTERTDARHMRAASFEWFAQGIVTNDRWKYVEYPLTGEAEMYNLANDPDELRNLMIAPVKSKKRVRRLQNNLSALLDQYKNCSGEECY